MSRLFSSDTPVSSTDKTDRHDITEILLIDIQTTTTTKYDHIILS
jgi:hypothetical protein